MNEYLLKCVEARESLSIIKNFLKNKDKNLSDRVEVFLEVCDLLPYASCLSDWPLSDHGGKYYESELIDYVDRGVLDAEEEVLGIMNELSKFVLSKDLDILTNTVHSDKDYLTDKLEALVSCAYRGVIIDW